MTSQRPPVAPKRSAAVGAVGSGAQYARPTQHFRPPRSPYEVGIFNWDVCMSCQPALSRAHAAEVPGVLVLATYLVLRVTQSTPCTLVQAVDTPSQSNVKPDCLEQEDELRAVDLAMMGQSASLPAPSTGGVTTEDRKAIRKEKNRASAAASRARREAYTASLEEEVMQHLSVFWRGQQIRSYWKPLQSQSDHAVHLA